MSAQELYESSVRTLPLEQRLQLASLILHDIAGVAGAVDTSTEWSDEDIADFTAFAMRQMADDDDD